MTNDGECDRNLSSPLLLPSEGGGKTRSFSPGSDGQGQLSAPGQDGMGRSEPTMDLGPRGRVIVVPDGSALARAAAERFARVVEQAVKERRARKQEKKDEKKAAAAEAAGSSDGTDGTPSPHDDGNVLPA